MPPMPATALSRAVARGWAGGPVPPEGLPVLVSQEHLVVPEGPAIRVGLAVPEGLVFRVGLAVREAPGTPERQAPLIARLFQRTL